MTRLLRIAAPWALLAAACLGCSEADAPPEDQAAVVRGNTAFAVDLYARLREADDGNLVVSPFSISAALAMTYSGARGNTAAQMAQVLHFDIGQERLHPAFASLIRGLRSGRDGTDHELHLANALWGLKGCPFRREFLALTRRRYGAPLHQADFVHEPEAARKVINDWAADETRGKIQDLVPPGVIDGLTRLVLVNAIYLKAKWRSEFRLYATRWRSFTLLDGTEVEAAMMHQTAEFRYAEADGVQVLELPYRGGDLSMVIVLPRARDGLPAVEQALTVEKLAGWLAKLREREIAVDLPRFTMTSALRLDEVLKALGMTDAFALGVADFSGMTDPPELFIRAVVHEAFIAVDEQGTVAAAATAVEMAPSTGTAADQPPRFTADHPFLFLIRHNPSGGILFLGRVMDPRGQDAALTTGAAES